MVCPPFIHHPAYAIPRAQPAHHLGRASGVVRHPAPGGRGSPPLRAVCIFRVAAFDIGAPPAHHFILAHPRYPSSRAGRAWKLAPTAGGKGIRLSPTPPSTPQSRPFGPCQLPFQGSREGVYGRTHVIRHPTPGGWRLYRLRGSPLLKRMGGLYAPWGASFPRGRGLCPRAWPWPRPRSAGCRWGGRRRK